MSTVKQNKTSAIEATARNAVEQGEKVWLAGLGVLAKAQSEGRDMFETDKDKLFDELVKAGKDFADRAKETGQERVGDARRVVSESLEKVRDRALDSYDRAVDQAGTGIDKVAEGLRIEQVFDHRVEKALKRLGYPTPRQYNSLKRKVDTLDNVVKPPKAKAKAKAKTKAKAASRKKAISPKKSASRKKAASPKKSASRKVAASK